MNNSSIEQEIEIKDLKGESKVSRLKIKPDAQRAPLRKPSWIRIKYPSGSKVEKLKATYFSDKASFKEISMGMSNDYQVAIEEGSTIIRIGTKIFGKRETTH